MKYYLYIDTGILQTLISSLGISDFDIDVMEFSIRQGETITNGLNINPTVDGKDVCENQKSNQKRHESYNKLEVCNNKQIVKNTVVERRYVNVEDISNIKNASFYDSLLNELEKRETDSDEIYITVGEIELLKLKGESEEYNVFLKVNNFVVWIDKRLLKSDLTVISTIKSKVTVIGYSINSDDNILRGVAMYI